MKCETNPNNCPIEVTLSLIGGKYKPVILLGDLFQQLHDLENSGIIHREVIPEKPPKTLYSLTAFGKSLIPILDAMCQWGNSYLDGLDVQAPCCQNHNSQ